MFGFAPARREVDIGNLPPLLDFSLELKPRAETARSGPTRPQGGFQNLTLTQNTENQISESLAAAPVANLPTDSANANEAFLVNGSLSRGLQAAQQEDIFSQQRRSEFEQRRGGIGADGAARAPGFQSSGPSGGGGFGGPGGFGGRGGGFGGRGGAPGGDRRGDRSARGDANSTFGNRSGRGRGSFRGTAFFTLQNSALDARPFSLTGQTVQKPSYAQSRFGLVGGGQLRIPKLIRSEKTFIFFNYFGTRGRNPFNQVATLPTLAERSGDFSQSFGRGPAQVFDPLTRLPFAGNRIPAGRLNPAALGLLRFIPLPNQPGGIQNYQYVTSVPNDTNNFGLRLNHTLSQKDRLDGNFNMQTRDNRQAQLYTFLDEIHGNGFNLSAGWTHNFSRRTIHTVRWNFSRNRSETLPFFAYSENVAAQLGINGVSNDPINFGPPNLNFTNFGGLTDASPVLRRDQTSGVNDSVTLVRGVHTIGVGGEYRRMQLNSRTDQNARGTFTFSGLATSAFSPQGQPLPGTGYDFADFLLGLPQSSSVRFGDTSTYFRASAYSVYLNDDWRARPNLTLDAGLRYEYFTPYHEKYNHIANLDIAPGFTGVAVVTPGQSGLYTGVFPGGLIDPDKNNVSPRLGFAWRPFSKKQFQVRGGYGLFYNGSIYNQIPSRLAAQPPFANTASVNTTQDRPLTIQNGFVTAPSQTITNTYAVDRGYRLGYAQTWNFAIQQSLPHSLVVELGYLGTKGTRLDIQRLPNRAAPGSPLTAEQRRQIGNAVGFTFDSSEGNSIYHAAQVRVTRRFSKGISLNALYTFSKSIDNASTLGGGAAVVAQNDRDLRAERGLSSFDQRHALTLSYILTSPVGENGLLRGRGWGERLLKDWTMSGGMTAATGLPFTARVLGNQADTGGTGSVGSGRADATGLPVSSGAGFFNPEAFTIPPPGRFGDAGRNTIPGPGRLAFNLSFGRSFRVDDRRRLEFRVDSQNFTNHVSFASINTIVNASNYGLPLAAASMRTMTATLRFRF